MVLLLVLVLVPILALGGYAFTQWMRAEARASQVAARRMQARWLAESGIEMAKGLLANPTGFEPGMLDLDDNPSVFAAQPVSADEAIAANGQALAGRYSLVAPIEDPEGTGGGTEVRYGLVSESAKIPLHRGLDKRDWTALMGLPGMTQTIAEGILDWIDADEAPREMGAEATYYLALDPPYEPRNAAPQTIGELLLVRDVTPQLLYGEDADLDGLLGNNEDDGDKSWPPDNADGVLDRGWFPYLTVHSASSNLSSTGQARLDLNNPDTKALESGLSQIFDAELANFVVQYRVQKKKINAISELIDATIEVDAPATPGGGGGSGSGAGVGGAGGGRGLGGLPLPPRKVKLQSPWQSGNAGTFLPMALDQLTVETRPVLKGKIDVLRAPAPVIQSLPGMTVDLAARIATAASQKPRTETTAAFLLVDGLVTLEQFRKLEPMVGLGGRVFRLESVGFFEDGPAARIEAILDASGSIPRVIQRQELTPLGCAYSKAQLWGSTGESGR